VTVAGERPAGREPAPEADIAGSPAEADGMATDSAPLRYEHTPRPYDADGVRRAVRDLLTAVGEDPDRDGLVGTPDRLARSFAEIFAGLAEDPADHLEAVFDIGHEEMVLVRDIPLYSMCEHHLLPFHGVAHVGYIPAENGRVTGLSKLARLVEGYARRPQVQERLTSQIADALVDRLAPRGVIVIVEAEHLCMSMRGVRKPGSRTITSAVRGQMRRAATRAEAMSLLVNRA
jgi:GTP cyclohydrolase IA